MSPVPQGPCSYCAGRKFSIIRRATIELGGLDVSADFDAAICNACGRTDWFLVAPAQSRVIRLAEQVTLPDEGPYR